jgi:hypothetical protein
VAAGAFWAGRGGANRISPERTRELAFAITNPFKYEEIQETFAAADPSIANNPPATSL